MHALFCTICFDKSQVMTNVALTCGKCHNVRYCGVEHQRQDWPRHRSECAIVCANDASGVDTPVTASAIREFSDGADERRRFIAARQLRADDVPVLIVWKHGSLYAQNIALCLTDDEVTIIKHDGTTEKNPVMVPGFDKNLGARIRNGNCAYVHSASEAAQNSFLPTVVKKKVAELAALGVPRLFIEVASYGGTYDVDASTLPMVVAPASQ